MEETKNIAKIEPEELNRWIGERKDFILIDTLLDEQFQKRHLPGARNACVFQVNFSDQVAALVPDKNRYIVLYGYSGKTMDAVAAAEKLKRLGYKNVYALEGGLTGWKEADYRLEGAHPDEVDTLEESGLPENGTYPVDLEQSVIEWIGRNPNTKHYGTLGFSKGEITVKDGEVGGTLEIDMNSIKNINLEGDEMQPVLISHLKSDDFFFVKMFPKAHFKIQSVTPVREPHLSAPNFEVRGAFELRGLRREITFPATVNLLEGGGANVEAHFDIDRTQWDVIYGSSRFFKHLGMHLVFDLISIELRIVAE
jgi:rhodanese-related sulfurtransferase/polyisoprenoid-binding protein YceI